MDDAGHGTAPAVVDIGHGTGNGACGRNTTEKGTRQIGHTLGYELCIGVMTIANDTISHSGRE